LAVPTDISDLDLWLKADDLRYRTARRVLDCAQQQDRLMAEREREVVAGGEASQG
jgi:hypothetical protein